MSHLKISEPNDVNLHYERSRSNKDKSSSMTNKVPNICGASYSEMGRTLKTRTKAAATSEILADWKKRCKATGLKCFETIQWDDELLHIIATKN